MTVAYPLMKDLFTPTLYWPLVESSLGIVGACLPLYRPIISEIYPVRSIKEIITVPSLSPASFKKPTWNARILEAGDISSSTVSSDESIYTGGNHRG